MWKIPFKRRKIVKIPATLRAEVGSSSPGVKETGCEFYDNSSLSRAGKPVRA